MKSRFLTVGEKKSTASKFPHYCQMFTAVIVCQCPTLIKLISQGEAQQTGKLNAMGLILLQ